MKQDITTIKRARWLLVAVLVANTIFWGTKVFVTVRRYNDTMKMAVGPNVTTTYSQRDPSSLVEISSLAQSDHATFVKWLNENGKDPVDYAVEVAKKDSPDISYLCFLQTLTVLMAIQGDGCQKD